MAKENDDTKPEGTESEESEEDDDSTAQKLLAQAQGKKPAAKKGADDDESDLDDAEEAEVEAGVSDTVSRAELVKAIKRRQAAATKARELQAQIDELKRTNETESEKAIREAQDKITRTLTGKYKPALIKVTAEAALLAANPKKGKEGLPRLIKLMDLDAIEVTDDLELEGVEEEVLRLQEEFPELFGEEQKKTAEDEEEDKPARRPATRRPTTRGQDGAGKKPPARKMSTSEIIMAKLRGDEI